MKNQFCNERRGLPEFKLNFDGECGEYFRRVKDAPDDNYSETVEGPDAKLWPSGRRWIQFLTEERKITFLYRNIFTKKININRLAKRYGCSVIPFTNLSAEDLNLKQDQIKFLNEAVEKTNSEDKKIDGFSLFNEGEKRIFYRNDVDKNKQRFVIAHELSHFLLGHNLPVFCKISNDKEPLETSKYHEEADKLAAIMLMPHKYIKKHMKKSNEDIAKNLQVPLRAVEKRKDEVNNEIYALCYK